MMRVVIVIAQACFIAALVFGSQSADQSAAKPRKQHFLIRITPARAGFVTQPTAAEQKVMGEHFAYLKKQSADGKVVLAGPSVNGDKTFGIIIVETSSEAEARNIMEGDPSVKAGVMKAEVLPFSLAILRGQ